MLQRLHAREDLSGDARRVLAGLELQLAKQKDDGLPGTQELDARKIRGAARADFRRVLESDPADLRALYQLSWLQATAGDVAGVRELLPAVEAAYYRRSDSPELAALAGAHAFHSRHPGRRLQVFRRRAAPGDDRGGAGQRRRARRATSLTAQAAAVDWRPRTDPQGIPNGK